MQGYIRFDIAFFKKELNSMSKIKIQINENTEPQIRKTLKAYDIELPLRFDFKQHISITFCTLTKK